MIITCSVQYRFMLQVHTRCNIFGSYHMSEHDQNLCTSGTDDQQKPHRIMAKERLLKGDFGFISKFAINATMKRNNLACKNGIPNTITSNIYASPVTSVISALWMEHWRYNMGTKKRKPKTAKCAIAEKLCKPKKLWMYRTHSCGCALYFSSWER